MLFNSIQPVRRLNSRVKRYAFRAGSQLDRYPVEQFPTSAFTIVLAAIGGMAAGQLGAYILPLWNLESPKMIGAVALLGIVVGTAGALKSMFWLNDRADRKAHENRN